MMELIIGYKMKIIDFDADFVEFIKQFIKCIMECNLKYLDVILTEWLMKSVKSIID